MSIATELTKLSNTKLDIKHAIQDKGVIVHDEDTFNTYADKIENIAGYGENIDISKVNYQIGSGYIGEYTGRILRGFADMGSKCAFPVIDINNTDMGVPWNDSFEIGIGFKFIAFPTYQSLFGDGNYNSYRRGARIYYSNNDNDFWLCISGDGSTLMVDAMLGFSPQLDTWYFIKLRFVKSTMKLTVDITEDFETYTNLYDNTLSTPPYYDSSAYLAIGGEARASEMASNTFLVDTFNTYVKNNLDEIVWGTFAGRFGNGEFPISGVEEYELYDYIESNGTGYIETNYHPVTGDVISARYTPTTPTMEYGWIYYAGEGTAYIGITYNPNGIAYWYNGSSGSSYYKSEQYYTDRIYNYDISISPSQNSTFKICYDAAYFKIYQVKINNDYLLPCRRKSDGIFGLYNVNQDEFLIDSNNGASFTGGNYIYTLVGSLGEKRMKVEYSTIEQRIGTWIDGKDLYQITLYTNTQVSLNNNNWTTIPWENEPSNITYLVSASIARMSPNTNSTLRFTLDDGHIKGASLNSSNYPAITNLTEYLTIQYTKN